MKPHGKFVQGEVVQLTDNTATLKDGSTLRFDYAAICTGTAALPAPSPASIYAGAASVLCSQVGSTPCTWRTVDWYAAEFDSAKGYNCGRNNSFITTIHI